MAFQTEDTSPPISGTRRNWWLRPIMDLHLERPATLKEVAARILPCFCAIFTVLYIVLILSYNDVKAHSHAKFSIQSITVDDSSATWQVDFLVKNPSSRFSIYYDGDDTAVKLDSINAAVLNISHKRSSRDLTAFSLDFVAEDNRNDVAYEQLDIKLRGKHKGYITHLLGKEVGYFNIKCQNLTRSGHENIKKINCQLSFSHLELFIS